MNAPSPPPFPTNPNVGQRFGQWVWNGSQWVCSPSNGIQVVTQVFTATGTYMPTPGLVTCAVECIGGGGGGGYGGPTQGTNIALGGGGGGSGGYSRKTLAASLVLGGVAVTIGAGGGSTGGGGTTSFGALCVANGGGRGGPNDQVNGAGYGGYGAAPGVGDIAFGGTVGSAGITITDPPASVAAWGGTGGAMWGGNYIGDLCGPGGGQGGGNAQPNTGAGGGGGVVNQAPPSAGAFAGGIGGSGICIVTEYCWSDAGTGTDCCPPPQMARVPMTWDSECGGPGWQGGPGMWPWPGGPPR